MTPQEFIAKWRPVELNERTAAQSHFNDLCRLLGLDDPLTADPRGAWFTFEKGVSRAAGGEGWTDPYGWGADWRVGMTDDEVLARLIRLNQDRAGGYETLSAGPSPTG